MKFRKKPKLTTPESARAKEIKEVLQDADLKKFDPELLDVAPQTPKKKPRPTH
jgi:signal recognition particle subunit SEC65